MKTWDSGVKVGQLWMWRNPTVGVVWFFLVTDVDGEMLSGFLYDMLGLQGKASLYLKEPNAWTLVSEEK